MSSLLITVNIGLTEVVGSFLTGASMILTAHSLSRMIFMRRAASKYRLFPIINVAQFINQFCIFLLITTPFNTISFNAAIWLNVINNMAYFITKPACMYLAYLRCSAVYPKFKKANWLHYFLISFRIIELLGIVVVNIIQNKLCNGSVAEGTKCEHLAIAWTFRDAASPLFRFYYITCEAVFYVTLFKTLKGMSDGKNIRLVQYRRLQTTLFTVDLILLSFMSIYRIIGIFDKTLPTYVYYELFSSTLTIFNLTEFGLNIRTLFHTVTDKNSSDPDSNSPSKMEMGSVNRGQSQLGGPTSSTVTHGDRKVSLPSKHTSTSPLTSFAAETGFNSDYDLSSSTTAVSSTHPQNYRDHSFQDEEYDAYFPFTPLNEATTNSVPSSPPLTGKGVRRVSGSNSISLPSRAFISSERSTRRQTNETL